ncbi:hypothetical protein [uncultured Cohaesibacter sp.]|uniref:hypothetical protein n=1 Tax=uncultured Cohaesibacter sp. TaxID=1002546 RepID=UPI0029C7D0C4|nr:hypothetical protein [uncultured Cohaesibacter sp.]
MIATVVSFLATKLGRYVAIGLVCIALLGTVYSTISTLASREAQIAELERQLEETTRYFRVEHAARAADTQQAQQDAKDLNDLRLKASYLDDYISKLEGADSICLDGADADRVRILWD